MLRFPSNHHLALCTLSYDGRDAVFYYDGSTQQEAVDEFQNVVDNPYPWEEME